MYINIQYCNMKRTHNERKTLSLTCTQTLTLAWEEYSPLQPCNNEYLVFIHPDANPSQEAVIATALRCFCSVASFSRRISSSLWLIGPCMYGFIANEQTSVLSATEEQRHGNRLVFIATKAEANWMQVAPITQLGAAPFILLKVEGFFPPSPSSVDFGGSVCSL